MKGAHKLMHSKTFKPSLPSFFASHDSPTELCMEQLQQISIESILESISDGIFIVNKELLITSFNRALEKITGIPRLDAIGQRCSKVFRSSLCEKNCVMQKTFATKTPMLNRQACIINAQGDNVPVNISTSLVRNRYNQVIGGVEIIQDLRPLSRQREKSTDQVQLDELITRNPTMGRVIKALPSIAASQDNVLIEGENGTGKEILARAIHAFSCRQQKPFLCLNCATLPDTPYAMELFGTRSRFFAAFHEASLGCSPLTGGGTLFLQEIGETSKNIQGQLLHILQEQTTDHENGTRSPCPDIRVIASTRRNLSPLMIAGAFRRDLYFHINCVSLGLPPLRERKEDIPLLIDHFISSTNQAQRKAITGVSQDAMDLLMAYNFPGNISELKNIIIHAYSSCAEGHIYPAHLPKRLRKLATVQPESFGMESAVQTVETQTIIAALKRNNYNRTAAARDLGIHKSTFFRKIKHLGIVLPQIDGRFRSIL